MVVSQLRTSDHYIRWSSTVLSAESRVQKVGRKQLSAKKSKGSYSFDDLRSTQARVVGYGKGPAPMHGALRNNICKSRLLGFRDSQHQRDMLLHLLQSTFGRIKRDTAITIDIRAFIQLLAQNRDLTHKLCGGRGVG